MQVAGGIIRLVVIDAVFHLNVYHCVEVFYPSHLLTAYRTEEISYNVLKRVSTDLFFVPCFPLCVYNIYRWAVLCYVVPTLHYTLIHKRCLFCKEFHYNIYVKLQ